jgi:hypothetical protein
VRLCGFAEDIETATTVARSVRAQLLLLDACISGVDQAAWPAKVRRIFLLVDSDSTPALRASGDACVAPDRLAHELGSALDRLFPAAEKRK